MNEQTITTPGGERLVLVPEAEFNALVAAAEDNADRAAVAEFRHKLAPGEEELIPSEIVDRLLKGESRIKVWREHRGLTSASLAERAGIGEGFLSQIETGKRDGTVETLRKIADALACVARRPRAVIGRGGVRQKMSFGRRLLVTRFKARPAPTRGACRARA